tara:strand:+ start:186 stop:1256 length:1071 start_codon:yes stop_codon:yes gene_type:complete
MALNVVSSDRLSTNVKISNLATGLSDKVGQSKNIIINGAMNVAQRGTSTTTTNTMCVDRYKCFFAGTDENQTFAQVALTSSDTGPWAKGFRNALQITNGNQTGGAAGADETVLYHQIEAQDLANSGWDYTSASSYATLSFWVKSSVAQTFYGYIATSDGTSQMYLFSTGALSVNTWKKVTVKIPGNTNVQFDNNNGVGLGISFGPYYGTDYTTSGATLGTWTAWNGAARNPDNTTTWFTTNDSTYAITGVQLEAGDTATEFEHRSYRDDLARCQRYCYIPVYASEKGPYAFKYHTSYKAAQEFFPVTMRAIPTCTMTYSAGSWTTYYPGTNHFKAYVEAADGDIRRIASAKFEAEL